MVVSSKTAEKCVTYNHLTEDRTFFFNKKLKSDRSVKLITQFHLVPRLRMCGVIRPFPQYIFKASSLVTLRANFTLLYLLTYLLTYLLHSTGYSLNS